MEHCTTHELMVKNTFFEYPDDLLVSYFNLTTKPLDAISEQAFCQIDHVLCGQNNTDMVVDCWTSRTDALKSHHFITIAEICISFTQKAKVQKSFPNVSALRNKCNRDEFYGAFVQHLTLQRKEQENLDVHAEHISDAFKVGIETLPKKELTAKRPWISEGTLDLIQRRNAQRHSGNYGEECRLNKLVRDSAKNDRQKFITEDIGNGG